MPRKPSQQLKNLLSNGIQKMQDTAPALVKPKKNFVTTILKSISIEPLQDNAVEEDESVESDKGTFINDAPVSIVLKQEPIDNDQSDITIVNEFDLVKHELVEVEPSNKQNCAIKEENLTCVKNEINTDMQNQTEGKESQIPEVNKDNLKSKRPYSRRKEAKKNIHICHICSVQFKCKSYLVRHMRVHTGERPYVCDTCDKKFAQNCHLVQHMRLHTGERPYSCHLCRNKSFNHRYNYKSHMRKHFGKPSHECHICNSAFHQKGDLKRHMLSHTGEKPYSCPKCDVRFSQKCHFTKHFAVIHGKRSHVCDLCKQEFDRKSDMKKHLATHTEKKPFRCHFKDCAERFDKKTHLNEHVRSHKGAKPFACDMCKLTYRQKGHLTKHIITIHDNPLTVLRKPNKSIVQFNQETSILKEEKCLHNEDHVEYIIP